MFLEEKEGGCFGLSGVVLIVLDSVRKDYFDRFASELRGIPHVNYENVWASSSWTFPSIVSILTGLLPSEHGCNSKAIGSGEFVKSCSTPDGFLPSVFKSRGFQTGLFSDNPYSCKFFGFNGFDAYVNTNVMSFGEFCFSDRLRLLFGRYSKSSFLFRKLYEFLDSCDSKSFSFVHLMDTHHPFFSPKMFLSYWRHCRVITEAKTNLGECIDVEKMWLLKKCYAESIRYLDSLVAVHVRKLLSLGLTVVVVSDHGEEFWEQGWFGHGYNLHDRVLFVPLMVFKPGQETFDVVDSAFSLKELFRVLQGKKPFEGRPVAELFVNCSHERRDSGLASFGKKHLDAVASLVPYQRRFVG